MFESVTHVFVEDGVPHMYCLRNRQLRWSWCRRYILGLLFVRGFFFFSLSLLFQVLAGVSSVGVAPHEFRQAGLCQFCRADVLQAQLGLL